MMKEKADYSTPDLDHELALEADELIKGLTESNARLSTRLKKQTITLQSLKEMRK
jgi:hypothetical protein